MVGQMPPASRQPERIDEEQRIGLARRLRAELPRLTLWSGTLHRFAEPVYARKPDRLQGVGASLVGGRWNPKGVPAVYASLDEVTALQESLGIERF